MLPHVAQRVILYRRGIFLTVQSKGAIWASVRSIGQGKSVLAGIEIVMNAASLCVFRSAHLKLKGASPYRGSCQALLL